MYASTDAQLVYVPQTQGIRGYGSYLFTRAECFTKCNIYWSENG